MIVPDYWAEARGQHRAAGRQTTVRRFGWSVTSEADALAMAENRASEALRRILAGEQLERREPKVAYNGAEGVPIREEVLERHDGTVITRNAYGAHCLNSENALFADVDFSPHGTLRPTLAVLAALVAASAVAGALLGKWGAGLLLAFLSLFAAAPLARLLLRAGVAARGGPDALARRRVADFVARRPDWSVRLYRTPSGLRLLATHRPYSATDEDVQAFFHAVSADPVYVRMCVRQRCFRARLSAKPWRIGISAHMRPRPGVWPVAPQRMAARRTWIAEYEARAAAFSACRYLETIGPGTVHPSLRAVLELHDRRSGALAAGRTLA